ncbi:nucleotidyltransferase domain-containing protein [Gracilibacillus kekensis]|nr:nucleotidyltransferase domain-containing protein [Gracilibacillus kekensis]
MEKLYNQIQNIAKHYFEIEKIVLFGSRAHNDHEDRSDIDLAVIAPKLTETNWFLFTEEIENLETLLKFDLIRWEHAPKELCFEIDKCNETIYLRQRDRN